MESESVRDAGATTQLVFELPSALAADILREACDEGLSVSLWAAPRLEAALKRSFLRKAIAEYEREFGEITDEEVDAARKLWRG